MIIHLELTGLELVEVSAVGFFTVIRHMKAAVFPAITAATQEQRRVGNKRKSGTYIRKTKLLQK